MMTVSAKLRQDLADLLSPETIRAACREAGYRWRNRLLDPVVTVSLFLLQVLNGNTACRHVVHFGRFAFSASAYCQARIRLPLLVLQKVAEKIALLQKNATAESANWFGHRVWVEDGSSFSMADVPALRDRFGQPTGQRPGCGFPVAKWVALFDLATGMLLRVSVGPMRTHDLSKTPEVESDVQPGDVILGDRGFCSYAHIAMLCSVRRSRGVSHEPEAVGRLHSGPSVADEAELDRQSQGAAALAVDQVERKNGSSRDMVQTQTKTVLDVGGNVRRASRRDHGARAALQDLATRIPRKDGYTGNDVDRRGSLPHVGIGRTVPKALASGVEFPAHQDHP